MIYIAIPFIKGKENHLKPCTEYNIDALRAKVCEIYDLNVDGVNIYEIEETPDLESKFVERLTFRF